MRYTHDEMKIIIANSLSDIQNCYPVMVQLRTTLSKDEFIERIEKQQKDGYKLVFVTDKGKVVSVAGFRISESLAWGKFIYVYDFITDKESRSEGYGDKLFDFLVEYARKEKCKQFHLDSGVQRFDAHRFYMKKRMIISSHHFSLVLDK